MTRRDRKKIALSRKRQLVAIDYFNAGLVTGIQIATANFSQYANLKANQADFHSGGITTETREAELQPQPYSFRLRHEELQRLIFTMTPTNETPH